MRRVAAIITVLVASIWAASAWADEQASKLPSIQVVLLTPQDVDPPAGAQRRITQIADYTEQFFNRWLTIWGYAPANKKLFRRTPGGNVELLVVRGGRSVASGYYLRDGFHDEAIELAIRKYPIQRNRHVWWIFAYVGDPPRRTDAYHGSGNSVSGGRASANYSTAPGEIQLGEEMAAGFLREFTLKGCIHELGHGLGLPHIGPRPNNPLGNSLMGPTNDVFARQSGTQETRVYLPQACAAMLWKHPVFSGTVRDRDLMPQVELLNYEAKFDKDKRSIQVRGRLASNYSAHSVVVMNDADGKISPYWVRGYASRLAEDGSFVVAVDEPVASGGSLKIMFCFNNGVVTGNGRNHGEASAILKRYQYADGEYLFNESAVRAAR